jgi:hypothetical protein
LHYLSKIKSKKKLTNLNKLNLNYHKNKTDLTIIILLFTDINIFYLVSLYNNKDIKDIYLILIEKKNFKNLYYEF